MKILPMNIVIKNKDIINYLCYQYFVIIFFEELLWNLKNI